MRRFFSGVGNGKSRNGAINTNLTTESRGAKSGGRGTKINDVVKLSNGNEAGLCNTNQIARAENNVVLDNRGVPDSLTEDANSILSNRGYGDIRTNDTGNIHTNKDGEGDEKNNGLDCNDSEAGLRDATKKNKSIVDKPYTCVCIDKPTDMQCANDISEQNRLENENSSDSASAGADISKTTNNSCHSNGDRSPPIKVENTDNRVQTKSCGSVDEDKDFMLSYDACKQNCRPGSVGLHNFANLCYVNSIVQCLSSVRELRTYLLCKYLVHLVLYSCIDNLREKFIKFRPLYCH